MGGKAISFFFVAHVHYRKIINHAPVNSPRKLKLIPMPGEELPAAAAAVVPRLLNNIGTSEEQHQ